MDLAFGYISQDYDDPRPWYDMPGAVEYQQVGGLDTDDDYSDPDWF